MRRSWWLVVAVAGVAVLMVVGQYNGLVRLREDAKAAWAQVENQLQRRNDLIPNYVNTVRGYARHEREVFEQIAEARGRLMAAGGTMAERAKADAAFSSALGRLMAIVEAYPQLKADQNFLRLQDELAGTENRIAVERKRYNDLVNEYNKRILYFPGNLIAKMFGFKRMEFFRPSPEAIGVPKVEF